jgi:hypothetical protein
MANPRNAKTLDGATSNGTGEETRTNGHPDVTLFVYAPSNLDTGGGDTFTVELQGSPDGNNWDTVDDDQGTAVSITESDVSQVGGSGAYTASVSLDSTYYEFLRTRLSNFNDAANGDLDVTAHVMAAGHGGSGTRGNPFQA